MLTARQAGKRVLLDVAEDLFDLAADFPWYRPMIAAADLVVCCSRALAARVREEGGQAIVIEDAVETGFADRREYGAHRTLTAGWIGMPENAVHAERLRARIEAAGHRLVTIHSGPDADVPWDLHGWSRALAACDVVIAPADVARQPSKSNNRVTSGMALGLPVVASPLDSYLSIVRDGENGWIARTDDEWIAALERLRDPAARARIGQAAVAAARPYALDEIGARWAALLFDAAVAPEVDIVIPTCGSTPYLAACLASVAACSAGVPHRVIVVANGGAAVDLPAIDDRTTTVVAVAERLTFAAAVNRGIAAGSAPYVCLLNDDTVVTRGWLTALLETARAGIAVVNPLSNADRGWSHEYDLRVGEVPLVPGANQLAGDRVYLAGAPETTVSLEALWSYAPAKTRLLERDWVAFYCTLIPRAALAAVGPLDEEFVNGGEDADFCRRARRLGYRVGIDERSFVFHFGGRSTSAPAMAATQERREAGNRACWAAKWEKPLFVVHAGYAWEPWTPEAIEHGIGGAETAAVHLCEALSRHGWRVVLFGCCPGREGIYGTVEYRDASAFDAFIARHHLDVFVASRWLDALERPLRASQRYLWLHDVWAMGTPLGEGDRLRALCPHLDAVLCLSPWHRAHVAHVHGISADRVLVTRNGIDTGRFAVPVDRQPGRFIYSSSPDRGLDVLLDLFPRIRAELPEAELHVFYGFDNWDKSLSARPDPAQLAWRARIAEAMAQPGVHYRGRVGQRQLAGEMLKSDVWLYPTSFHETSCITALEAQAAGVACVCSDLAALTTTVGDRGVLLPGDPRSPEYQARAVAAAVDLVRDRPRRDALTMRARAWALGQTWDAVAAEWNDMCRAAARRGEVVDVVAQR
jgi:glycosyltransferase involved in cell wall biosynthesis